MMMQVQTYRDNLCGQIVDFTYQENGAECKRSGEVVKSIPVFVTQAYCLFDLPDLVESITSPEIKKIFEDPNKLLDLKRKFIRFATEEVLRRKCEPLIDQKILSVLFQEYKSFIDKTFAVRSAEIEEQFA